LCIETKGAHSAFIAKQNNTLIKREGNCDDRHYPVSTFKVALSLMGFDSGFFETPDSPTFPFKEAYEKNLGDWYTRAIGLKHKYIQAQTPITFMKNSVIWVYHLITQHLDEDKLKEYVEKLNCGNPDISGGPLGSLFDSWLSTSLKISPREQMEFLEKLLVNELVISKDAQAKTKVIMDKEEKWENWKLYGKTGGGSGRQTWFIGWIEKGGEQPIIFAQFLDKQDPKLDLTTETSAKEVAKKHLENIWKEAADK
jgi:beta-lactamase class D